MRAFLGLTLIALGFGLCLLNPLAHSLAKSVAAVRYHNEIQSLPQKDSYTRAEIADSMWRVWTNRVLLPAQDTYTAEELKSALLDSAHVIGSSQNTADRAALEVAVRYAAGYERRADNGLAFAGVLLMLVGAFVLGMSVRTSGSRKTNSFGSGLKPPTSASP